MKNWKTFLSSVCLAISLQGDTLGLPPKIVKVATTVSVLLFGSAAKDKDVTGGSRLNVTKDNFPR